MKFRNVKVKKRIIFGTQRREVAHLTSASWKSMPHAAYIYEPDITEFYEEFMVLARERKGLGYKISFNTIMLKVIVEGLLKAPRLNSYVEYNYTSSIGRIYILDEINIAMPWVLPDGRLINPNLLNAEKKSLNEMAEYISDISKKLEKTNMDELLYQAAFRDTIGELKRFNFGTLRRVFPSEFTKHRAKRPKLKERFEYYRVPMNEKLIAKDLISGTITLTNIGSLYKEQKGYFGMLDIIFPQSCIIGISAVQERPAVFINENGNKEIGIRKIFPMCIVFDHRASDLDAVFPFVSRLDEIFSSPKIIHSW